MLLAARFLSSLACPRVRFGASAQRGALILVVGLCVARCGDPPSSGSSVLDSGPKQTGKLDSGQVQAGQRDAGRQDGGHPARPRYRAQVRWTSYGIPHFVADDMASVAYASGYVTSKDTVCIVADQVVRLRSERAKYFGPGELDTNLTSDFGILAAGVRTMALRTFGSLDDESRSLIVAYAAGYNRYLAETPSAALPLPCRDARWVRPIAPEDLWTYYYYLSMGPGIDDFFVRVGEAAPDASSGATTSAPAPAPHVGSNGWAIGKDKSESGHGMLLATPHLPWQGPRRLYEQHITVPGSTNVYGAGWTGLPLVAIGFNEAVAFTHTASTASHITLYKLELVPGQPTHYMFDGDERTMSAHAYQIEVAQEDGSLTIARRTLYSSHYGPMLGTFGTPWSDESAYTYRDANDGNVAFLRTYLGMNRARDLTELEAAQATARGLSWLNIIAVSKDGRALFFDATRTPALSEAAEQALRAGILSDYETALFRNTRQTMLLGDSALSDWKGDDPRIPGIFAHSASPRLERSDFVANANDSHWLINPSAPLTGFSKLFGDEGDDVPSPLPPILISARTRMNLTFLTEQTSHGASGSDGKFSFSELAAVPYNNRALLGELLRDSVVERCRAQPSVDVNDKTVDLRTACSVLASWDLRVDADSVGAVLWRAFLSDFANIAVGTPFLFADAMDVSDPIATPRTLVQATPEGDTVVPALGRAVDRLESVGASVSATLGALQFTQRGAQRFPISGGADIEGAFDVVSYQASDGTLLPGAPRGAVLDGLGLTSDGYPVNAGSSFLLVSAFTDEGPEARALLTYSQSADPNSPHYSDQTQLFSQKAWRDVRFRERDIVADPELREVTVEGSGPSDDP